MLLEQGPSVFIEVPIVVSFVLSSSPTVSRSFFGYDEKIFFRTRGGNVGDSVNEIALDNERLQTAHFGTVKGEKSDLKTINRSLRPFTNTHAREYKSRMPSQRLNEDNNNKFESERSVELARREYEVIT